MTVPLVLIRPVARRWLSAGELQRRFVDLQPAGAMTGHSFPSLLSTCYGSLRSRSSGIAWLGLICRVHTGGGRRLGFGKALLEIRETRQENRSLLFRDRLVDMLRRQWTEDNLHVANHFDGFVLDAAELARGRRCWTRPGEPNAHQHGQDPFVGVSLGDRPLLNLVWCLKGLSARNPSWTTQKNEESEHRRDRHAKRHEEWKKCSRAWVSILNPLDSSVGKSDRDLSRLRMARREDERCDSWMPCRKPRHWTFMFFTNLNHRFHFRFIRQANSVVVHLFGEAHGFFDGRNGREYLLKHWTTHRQPFSSSDRWISLLKKGLFFPLSSFSSGHSLISSDGSISCRESRPSALSQISLHRPWQTDRQTDLNDIIEMKNEISDE